MYYANKYALIHDILKWYRYLILCEFYGHFEQLWRTKTDFHIYFFVSVSNFDDNTM